MEGEGEGMGGSHLHGNFHRNEIGGRRSAPLASGLGKQERFLTLRGAGYAERLINRPRVENSGATTAREALSIVGNGGD